MALLSRFFGRAASEGAAFALGLATGPVLQPAVQELVNEAWRTHPSRAVEPGDAAEIVAEDVELRGWGADEAAAHGMDGERFDALTNAVRNAPGFSELIRILRRHPDGGPDFIHGLRKARLETRWDNLLSDLQHERLDPSVVANAIQQGYMDDAGVLPKTPDQTPGKVTTEPPVNVDTLKEAKAGGYDIERLKVLARLAGLPPGPEALAAMVFRSIIETQDYSRGVGQGHTKNEWADALLEYSRQIPTVTDYVVAHLKGWIKTDEMYTGTARHGMSKADTDLIYLRSGRPAAPGQMATAAARGINGPDGTPMNEAQFLKGIKESDIRPEWGPMLWESRYLYPPLFQLTRLVTAGTITPALAAEWATKDRYAPEVVNALRTAWESGGAATSKGLTVTDLTAEYEALTMSRTQYVNGLKELGYSQAAADGKVSVSDAKRQRLARNQLINRARVRYTTWKITKQAASDALRAAALTIGNANDLLTYWDAERDLNVHTLTEPQVVKAWKKQIMDRPTAVERLSELGLAQADIDTRLDES